MNTEEFYGVKLKRIKAKIEKVRLVKVEIEKLHNAILSVHLRSANEQLDLVIVELRSEYKHVEILLKEERLLTCKRHG